ncbi:methyltransferase domain-containing protein [Nitratireductor sp. ZSWI3]|uniref:methyltransferase domain-containing protein n=1 Tax=Nitratireductor sp. ZSWI3 TaxID=2966359 RepID=UPI0021501868|nr:methyltransferase domain-containing protein [Nitratireductor sp. ZSWI3]MCR4267952.1 methyltransferase domain-containing protein [Nitratireductor sp. ZSWI3]
MEPLFDPHLLIARKKRALQRGDAGADFLMQRAAADLSERLATVERRFDKAAALFCLTGDAAAALRESGKVGDVVRIEADPLFLDGEGVVAPPETLPLEAASLDLAVSLLTLHETNDTPGLLAQIRRSLKPDGLFLGAMAGAGTLQELRQSLLEAETEISHGAAPRVSPFADVRDVGGLLQRAGFALPVADIESLTVRYATMFDLMRDLRAMGATNALQARSLRPATRALFLRAAQIYAERFSDPDGRIRATFNFVWMSGWAPHASQQKPLAPGSAKMSLKDALEKRR